MTEEIAIKVENVSKDFKLIHERNSTLKNKFTSILKGESNRTISNQHTLKSVSFNVKKGEFFGIVGRNGSGKSTLLKILAQIYQPTKGKVSTDGKLVPFIELGVGFNPELTGRDNVYLNGAMLGFSKKEIDTFYRDVVDFAELAEFMDKKLKNYSSGMQVRLAFSMAIRAKADILLIDEVLAVGDDAFKRKCYDYFRGLRENNTTAVFVSHDMEAVKSFCDRAIMIDDGSIVSEGDVVKVSDEYTKLFLKEKIGKTKEGINSKKWGDGSAEFIDVNVENNRNDKKITISTTLKANKNISNILLGFAIKSQIHQNLLGTNNKVEELRINSLKGGKIYKVSWEVPKIFNEGRYRIDLAVSYQQGEIAQRWENAAELQIIKKQDTPFIIRPDIKMEFHEK